MCLVAADVVLPAVGANKAPQSWNLRVHFKRVKEREKGRKEGERKRSKGTEGAGEHTPPEIKFLFTVLA